LKLASLFLIMNTNTQILSFFLIAVLGFGTRHADAADPPPVIDFPLLGEVRTLDLIDGTLGFPKSLKKFEGSRVSMVGFMAPFDDLRSMRRCMIVPSYVGCKFCNPPDLNQVVYITQGGDDASQLSYPFIEEPAHVSGILRLSLPESDHEGKKKGFVYSLEDAVVTVHRGDAPERAPGHRASPHQVSAQPLAPVPMDDLVRKVADLLGQEPLRPIEIERVSDKTFGDFVRNRLEATFPKSTRTVRTRAFSLLGLIPEDADWIETLAGFELYHRVVATNETGDRILLLDTVPDDHPFVRLDLVGAIADALVRQRIARDRTANGDRDKKEVKDENDDVRRAREALCIGIGNIAIRRYARWQGISLAVRPPVEFVPQRIRNYDVVTLERWQSLPRVVGTFFADFLVGPVGPLTGLEPAFARPPSTTIEFFRPLWYQDSALWRRDPVPSDFADNLLETPPNLTDVLGIGGLVPWLATRHSGHAAMSLSGRWAGDRWAVWQFPDGSAALLLETRWQDEKSALRFREAIPDHPLWHLPPHRDGSTRVQLLRADSPAAIDRLTSALRGSDSFNSDP